MAWGQGEEDLLNKGRVGLHLYGVSTSGDGNEGERTASFIVDSFAAVLYAKELLADSIVRSSITIYRPHRQLRMEGRRGRGTNLARYELVNETLGSLERSVTIR